MTVEQKQKSQMSGAEFVALVKAELAKRNSGLGRLSRTAVSKEAGLSPNYLSGIMMAAKPNPTLLAMRAVLYVLGFQIERPEDDVIPHLKSKGVYAPEKYREAS